MKRTGIAVILLISAMIVAGCASEHYAQYGRGRSSDKDTVAMMKKQDVISLSKAGVSDSLIITMLDASDSWFQLKPGDVIELKNAGVSDNVINAMLAAPSSETGGSNDRRYYYYPSYYWSAGYYPFWYYPSSYFGFRTARPVYVRSAVFPRRSYFGGRRVVGGGRRRY